MTYRHRRVAHLVCGALLCLISTAAVGASTFEEGSAADDAGDYQTAIKKWQILIQEGSADGLYFLGVMYAQGKGVAQDKARATKLYMDAAQKGHLPAQYNLGMQYATGDGVAQDFRAAEYWWIKAAEGGLMPAQFNLGNLYYFGLTGEKNPVRARKWLALAAKQGSPHAKESLAKLDAEEAKTPGAPPSVTATAPPPVAVPDTAPRPATDTLRREAWVLAQPPRHYTIQILSLGAEAPVREYIKAHDLSANAAYFESQSQGAAVFRLIYGSYPSRNLANKALATLPRGGAAATPLWIRTFAELQALVDRKYAKRGAP